MGSILVKGELIVTMDSGRRVLRDSAVYVENDRIVEVGNAASLKLRYHPEITLVGEKRIVLPGFVNCHDHSFITIFRHLADNRGLFEWVNENIIPIGIAMDCSDAYESARLCFAEQIRSGITTTVDDSVPSFRNSINKRDLADRIGLAAAECGQDVIQAIGGTDLEEGLGANAKELIYSPEKARSDLISLIRRYNGTNKNVKIWANSTWLPACSADMYKTMKQTADQYRTFAHAHIAESVDEFKLCKRRYGKTPIEFLKDIGFLGSNTCVAHAIWVTEEDITRLKDTDTRVSHQPICNEYLGSGIAPIPKMLRRGITVGLGIDDGGHANEDFFCLMKSCALLHKVNYRDPSVLSAQKVLEIATIGGARAVGLDREIGSLEPGKLANLIVIDYNRLNLWPPLRPIVALVYGGMETDICTTIINGEIVMDSGKLTKVDEQELLEATAKTAWNLMEKGKAWDLVNENSEGWQLAIGN